MKYIDSTLYDYYSDYELNGKTREENKSKEVYTNRAFVEFEQFNRALSDYYKDYEASPKGKKVQYPLYTGHFQPEEVAHRFLVVLPETLTYMDGATKALRMVAYIRRLWQSTMQTLM